MSPRGRPRVCAPAALIDERALPRVTSLLQSFDLRRFCLRDVYVDAVGVYYELLYERHAAMLRYAICFGV